MKSTRASKRQLLGYVFIIGAATSWGLAGTGAKYLFNREFDVFLVVQTRATISCILLWLAFGMFARKKIARITLPQMLPFALLGIIGIAGSNFMYYQAMKLTNVATAIIIQYSAPVFVMLWEIFRRREILTRFNFAALLFSMIGCFLTIGGFSAFTDATSVEGILWAFGSAFSFSFFNIYGKGVLKNYEAWIGMLYSLSFTSLFWFILNPPWTLATTTLTVGDWSTLFVFALCSILIPYGLYFQGLRRIPSSHAIIIATLEPVIASVSAAFLVNELLSASQYVGAVSVLVAIALLARHHDASLTPVD